MSADRTVILSPEQRALKVACKAAVSAAGGQEFISRQVGLSQSRISDLCSSTVDEWMRLDMVLQIDALGAGTDGHPHIARALARALGHVTLAGEIAPGEADWHLGQWLAEIVGEHADLTRVLAQNAALPGCARSRIQAMRPEERAVLAREIDQLIGALAGLNSLLGDA